MNDLTKLRRRGFLQAATMTAVGLTLGRRANAFQPATTNEKIQQARQAALALLQPSESDLTRGLQLHADSVVFDAYGFAPRTAVDGAAFQAAIDGGASDEELQDLREEMIMIRQATDAAERAEFFEAFHASGVTCIFQNAGEEGSDTLRLLKRLSRFTFVTDVLRDVMPKAIGPDDVVAAKKAGRVCLALTTNGVPLRLELNNVRDELRNVRLFRHLGVRMMHLTYNRRNLLGDGAGETTDGGVSDFGKYAIGELNRQGIIVDVAHSGWRTSRESAQISTRPMVASHTTCAGLFKHFRGKPDDVIKAICDTDGLIGICCIPQFLGGQGDLVALLDHLDYAIKKFGPEHVAIGTDVAYISRNEATEAAKINRPPKSVGASRARWESLWPADSFKTTPEAKLSLSWTNWPLFTVGLVQRGHSDDVIRKVLGENMLRVWRANETTAS